MNVLVSACLVGVNCRYNGEGAQVPGLDELMGLCHLVPVCPEIFGGLSTPREPSERQGERVTTRTGRDVTAAYERGAGETARLGRLFNCRYALLKERSPSCGRGKIYDGTFSGKLTNGDGVAAGLLEAQGIRVFGESQVEELIKELKRNGE